MPDGNIQLTVTLTPQDVKAKSVQLRNEIQKIFESTNTGGLTKSMENLLNTMDTLNNKAEMIHKMMHKMETTKVVNPHLKELREEVKQASKDIEHFSSLRKKMLDEGVDKDGEEYNKVTEAMFNSIHKAADATAEIGKLYDSGQDKITEAKADPETYNALKVAMGEVNNEMAVTTSQFNAEKQAAEGAGDGVAKAGEATAQATPKVGAFNRAVSATKNGLGAARGHVSKFTSAIRGRLSKALSGVKRAIQRAFSFKGITRGLKQLVRYTFGVYSLVAVFNKLKNAAKEGMQNLVQYQSGTNATNKAMTEFNTSLLYIKNAWAAAFAPVINFVMPVLTQLMDIVAQVGNTIARFVGVLTGQKQVLQAVKVSAGDYAKSLDKTGKAADKAKNKLAAYDKLMVINSDNDGSGSGGANSDTPKPSDMFTKVDVDENEFSTILDFIDKVKKKVQESGIVEAFENLKKAFDNFKNSPFVQTMKDIIGILADDTITSVLGLITDGLTLLANILNGDLLGSLGSLRDIFADLTFDPLITLGDIVDRLLGTGIGDFFRDLKDAVKGIDIKELPGWEKLQGSLEKFKDSWEKLKIAIQNFWNMLEETGVLDAIKKFVVWLVEQHLDGLLKGISTALDAVGGAMDIIADILNGDFLSALDDLKNLLATLTFQPLETLAGVIDSFAGSDMAGWLKGIEDAIKNFDLGKWLSELPGKIGDAFGKVKEFFQPVEDFFGKIKGFIDEFKSDPFGKIKQGWDGVVEKIKSINLNPFDKIKEGWETITDKIKSVNWSELGKKIGENVGTAVKNLKDKFVEFFTVTLPGFGEEVKKFFTETIPNFITIEIPKWWDKVKESAKTFFTVTLPDFFTKTVPNAFKSVGESIWNGIKSGWDAVMDVGKFFAKFFTETVPNAFKSVGESIWNGILAGWNALLAAGQGIWDFINGFLDGFKSALGIHSPSTVFKGFGENIVEGLKNGISGIWEAIKGFFVGENGIVTKIKKNMNFDALKTSITTAWDNIKKIFTGFWDKIKSWFSGDTSIVSKIKKNFSFDSLKTTVEKVWNTIKGFFTGTWDKIKSAFTGKDSIAEKIKKNFSLDSLKTSVSTAWGKVTGIFTGAWDKLKSTFDANNKNSLIYKLKTAVLGVAGKVNGKDTLVGGIVGNILSAFENLKTKIKSPLNAVIGFFEGFVNKIIDGINFLVGKINGLKIEIPKIGGGSTTYGFNFPTLKYVSIPRLAQGAVIPPNKEFMALLGDQKQGTNIEAPLNTMVEAFERALDSRGSTNHEPIVLQLDGRVIAKTVWDEEAKKYKQTGFGLSY